MIEKLISDKIPSVDDIINETWNILSFSEKHVREEFGEVLMRFDEEMFLKNMREKQSKNWRSHG